MESTVVIHRLWDKKGQSDVNISLDKCLENIIIQTYIYKVTNIGLTSKEIAMCTLFTFWNTHYSLRHQLKNKYVLGKRINVTDIEKYSRYISVIHNKNGISTTDYYEIYSAYEHFLTSYIISNDRVISINTWDKKKYTGVFNIERELSPYYAGRYNQLYSRGTWNISIKKLIRQPNILKLKKPFIAVFKDEINTHLKNEDIIYYQVQDYKTQPVISCTFLIEDDIIYDNSLLDNYKTYHNGDYVYNEFMKNGETRLILKQRYRI